jgi:hypothetical protein
VEIQGTVQNGVIVLDGGACLPEGTVVSVKLADVPSIKADKKTKRVLLPLMTRGNPGSLSLTNAQIDEILNTEEVESAKRFLNAPS